MSVSRDNKLVKSDDPLCYMLPYLASMSDAGLLLHLVNTTCNLNH